MKEHSALLSKWLRMLFYVQIASMVITAVNAVSNLEAVTRWISKALSLATVWSLFQLKAVNPRYRTSALTSAGVFICGLLTTPVNSSALGFSSILLLVGSTCGWVSDYQEYHGHEELVKDLDAQLAKKWGRLFVLEILIGLGISTISVFGTTILVAAGMLSGTVTTVIIALSTLCGLALNGLYLHYMKQTLALIEPEV